MSDRTLLVSVEDLIYTAFGESQGNKVNFKMLHTILHILARQMRLLERDVEIKVDDIVTEFIRPVESSYVDESGTYSSSSSEQEEGKGGAERGRARKDRARKEEKGVEKERIDKQERGEKDEKGEKDERKGRRGKGAKEDDKDKRSSKDWEEKSRPKDRDEKDKRAIDRNDDRDEKDKRAIDRDDDRDDKDKHSRDRDDKGKHDKGKRSRDRADDRDDKGKRSRDRDDDRDDKGKRSRDRDDKDKHSRDRDDKGKRSRDRDDKDKRSRDRDDKDKRSRDKDDKDKRSRDIDRSSRGRRGEDYGDEGGREHGRGRKRRVSGERGADGRGSIGGEREDRYAQGQVRGGRVSRQMSGTSRTSITVSEATRISTRGSAEKILVAERRPAARGPVDAGVRPARIGSIEVVTASQFALLGRAVKQLEQITRPLPEPVLPDNQTLREDLVQGRASLQDTMQAVQLNARVQAAEKGLSRMAELLTQLAQSGKVPPEFAGRVGAIEEYMKAARAAGHAAAGRDAGGAGAGPVGPGQQRGKPGIDVGISYSPGTRSTASQMDGRNSIAAVDAASQDTSQGKAGITHCDLEGVLTQMREAFYKEINDLTARANYSANVAASTSRDVADKLKVVMNVDARVTTLLQQTQDYAKQMDGFDSGNKTLLHNFEEELVKMREDLAEGLALLDAPNNNAATAALLDLTERHRDLVVELENIVLLHQKLYIIHQQNSDEQKNLMKCLEMLREQKADRDEVFDGLRDKADLSRLVGMLQETDFARARSEIDKRISNCYEVFRRQELKWENVLADLMAALDNKAEIIKLMALKDTTNLELNATWKVLRKLEMMVGEPKAALLMRKLAKDAACGACMTRALMEPEDPTYGKPTQLPMLRPPPLGAEQEPCFGEFMLAPPDIRPHTCHRWVGGSHTLISNIAKVKAEYMKVQNKPTKKFEGYGFDGRLYKMEEDVQPCVECNQLSTDQAALVSPHPPTSTGESLVPEASAPTRRRKGQRW